MAKRELNKRKKTKNFGMIGLGVSLIALGYSFLQDVLPSTIYEGMPQRWDMYFASAVIILAGFFFFVMGARGYSNSNCC